jgi:putative transcriptional regulator
MPVRNRIFPYFLLCFAMVFGGTAIGYMGSRAPSEGSRHLTGQFLVANPRMTEPLFAETVIYVVHHDDAGALGFVVNRVYGSATLKEVLSGFGIVTSVQKKIDLHYGGPVENLRGFVLHSGDYTGTGTQVLGPDLSLSFGVDILQAIAKGRGPRRALLLLGYAGWSAGQLDGEVARGDWWIAPADLSLIFSEHPEAVWEQALKRAGIAL